MNRPSDWSCTWGMMHTKTHQISPDYTRPVKPESAESWPEIPLVNMPNCLLNQPPPHHQDAINVVSKLMQVNVNIDPGNRYDSIIWSDQCLTTHWPIHSSILSLATTNSLSSYSRQVSKSNGLYDMWYKKNNCCDRLVGAYEKVKRSERCQYRVHGKGWDGQEGVKYDELRNNYSKQSGMLLL